MSEPEVFIRSLQVHDLLIFDEVITGFRVSPGGAQVRYGVTPWGVATFVSSRLL